MKPNVRMTIVLMLILVALSCPALASSPVTGAIFTTVVDGSIVNANVQYTSKCDVYLNGGPPANAPAGAAGLPSGYYYFQVTDPSGQTLLSTDAVANRQFHINASGVIDQYTGSGGPPHPTGISQDHPELGTITVRLANATCPADYLDTPNGGGVYKAWVTPVADFAGDPTSVDNACGDGCFHGFLASKSKTDNFKIRPTTATFCLTVIKQLVDSSGGITPGTGWSIQVTDSSVGVTNSYTTNGTDGSLAVCNLVAGTYTVTESLVMDGSNYNVVGLQVNGATLPPQSLYSFFWSTKNPDPFVVVFQNQKVATGPQ
jgi:hypothetical protein